MRNRTSSIVSPGPNAIATHVPSTLDSIRSRIMKKMVGDDMLPTVLFIVERLRRREAPLPWLLLGFGPGLCAEAVLLAE